MTFCVFLTSGNALKIPAYLKLLYSSSDITSRVAELGAEIGRWAESVYEKSGKDVLAIPVLRGGIFFFSDLVRHIPASVDVGPVRSSSYLIHEAASSEVKIHLDGVVTQGRSVILMDDVCDSGKTLASLSQQLLALGATEVRSAVLVKRVFEYETFEPDYVGYRYSGKEWFVGYGMDDQGRWRNLSSIYIVEKKS